VTSKATDLSTRPMFCVDWDGTCVEEAWPENGEWLPGAVSSLRYLSSVGKTIIYSLRCHLYEHDEVTLRPPGAAAAEVAGIRERLDEVGLHDVEVYPHDRGKPPALYYIDDRAVRFRGDWVEVLDEIRARELTRDMAALRKERDESTHVRSEYFSR